MEQFFRVFHLFFLIAIALFLGCAQRDNQFDPASPLYVGIPPDLKVSCNLEIGEVLKSVNDTEYVVRPGTKVSFNIVRHHAQTDDPLPVSLKVIHNNVVTSTSDDISSLDTVQIPLGDSGKVQVLFTITDNLSTIRTYTFTIKQNRKPSIQEFKPKVITENIVWVGKKSYVDFRIEILDPDSLLDSIIYLLAPDSIPDSNLYIYDTSKSDKKIITSASVYVDTVSLECYSDTAADAYVIAVITDKLGRTDSTKSVIYFNLVDLSKRPEIINIPYKKDGEDSNIVCFNPAVNVYNGDLSNARYTYDFGDGDTSSSNRILQCHKFTSPGTYTVTLTVMDGGGASDTSSVKVDIRNPTKPGKILRLNTTPDSGEMPLKVYFELVLSPDISAKDIISVTWNFGDKRSSSGSNLKEDNTYYVQGKYFVKAILSTIGGNDTVYDTVGVYPKYIRYTPFGSVKVGGIVRFWLENYNQPYVKHLRWTVSDSVTVTNFQDTLEFSIKRKGFLDVKVETFPDSGDIHFPMTIESIFINATPL